jgi:hypothetical protein
VPSGPFDDRLIAETAEDLEHLASALCELGVLVHRPALADHNQRLLLLLPARPHAHPRLGDHRNTEPDARPLLRARRAEGPVHRLPAGRVGVDRRPQAPPDRPDVLCDIFQVTPDKLIATRAENVAPRRTATNGAPTEVVNMEAIKPKRARIVPEG